MTSKPPGMFPNIGDTIVGRYRLDRMLARGGMGVVYLGRQLSMDREVAVKMVLPHNQGNAQTLARFEREVHLAKQLRHPNVVELYDFGRTEGGFLYLVMEYLEGYDLKRVLGRDGPFTVERCGHIALQVLDALAVAHDMGIVHRDLKPSNIFTVAMGRHQDFVKLLDFGIAKSLGQEEDVGLTKQGQVCGTSAYMAPEMFLRGAVNLGVDVYAMGLIILEMLIGQKVVQGNTTAENMILHLKRGLTIPAPIAGTPLALVIEKATTKRPDDRYPDANAMLDDLEIALEQTDGSLRVDGDVARATVSSITGDALLDELLGDGRAAPDLGTQTAESSDILIIETESGNTFGPASLSDELVEPTAPIEDESDPGPARDDSSSSGLDTLRDDQRLPDSGLQTLEVSPDSEGAPDQQSGADASELEHRDTVVMRDGPSIDEALESGADSQPPFDPVGRTVRMPREPRPSWIDDTGDSGLPPDDWLASPKVWIPAGVAVGAMLVLGIVLFATVMSGGQNEAASEPVNDKTRYAPLAVDGDLETVSTEAVSESNTAAQTNGAASPEVGEGETVDSEPVPVLPEELPPAVRAGVVGKTAAQGDATDAEESRESDGTDVTNERPKPRPKPSSTRKPRSKPKPDLDELLSPGKFD